MSNEFVSREEIIEEIADNFANKYLMSSNDRTEQNKKILKAIIKFVYSGRIVNHAQFFDISLAYGEWLTTLAINVGIDRYFNGSYVDDETLRTICKFKILARTVNCHNFVEIVKAFKNIFADCEVSQSLNNLYVSIKKQSNSDLLIKMLIYYKTFPIPIDCKLWLTFTENVGKSILLTKQEGADYGNLYGGISKFDDDNMNVLLKLDNTDQVILYVPEAG